MPTSCRSTGGPRLTDQESPENEIPPGATHWALLRPQACRPTVPCLRQLPALPVLRGLERGASPVEVTAGQTRTPWFGLSRFGLRPRCRYHGGKCTTGGPNGAVRCVERFLKGGWDAARLCTAGLCPSPATVIRQRGGKMAYFGFMYTSSANPLPF